MFPQCLCLASEASLRTRKCCMQLITSHDKKDCDGKTNGWWRYCNTWVIYCSSWGRDFGICWRDYSSWWKDIKERQHHIQLIQLDLKKTCSATNQKGVNLLLPSLLRVVPVCWYIPVATTHLPSSEPIQHIQDHNLHTDLHCTVTVLGLEDGNTINYGLSLRNFPTVEPEGAFKRKAST